MNEQRSEDQKVPGPKDPRPDGCRCGDYPSPRCPVHKGKWGKVRAQHDETGRMWEGPRGQIPKGFSEIPSSKPGFEAYVAHVICCATEWRSGAGTFPPRLQQAVQELREYVEGLQRAADEPRALHEGHRQSFLKFVECGIRSGMLGDGDRSDILDICQTLKFDRVQDVRLEALRASVTKTVSTSGESK